jgi:FtsH-binding integral membrane protein
MMFISDDLLAIMVVRTAILTASGLYLFRQWFRAPRRYFSDMPFLMGVSFVALAASKVFDIFLYSMFLGEPISSQNQPGNPGMPLAYIRWLLILVVLGPLVFVNLQIWLPDRPKVRGTLLLAYISIFAALFLSSQTYAELNALLPAVLFPPALLTICTFLFAYKQHRLPGVHGLLIGIGWIIYLVSICVRPTLMSMGPPPWGYVNIAELIDMGAWMVIFLGFVLKPKYKRQAKAEVATKSIEEQWSPQSIEESGTNF